MLLLGDFPADLTPKRSGWLSRVYCEGTLWKAWSSEDTDVALGVVGGFRVSEGSKDRVACFSVWKLVSGWTSSWDAFA